MCIHYVLYVCNSAEIIALQLKVAISPSTLKCHYVFSIMSLDRKKEYKTPSPSPWHPSSSSFFLHFACLKIALDHLILFWNVWKLGSRLVSNYPFGCLSKIAIEKLFFLVKLENKLQTCLKGPNHLLLRWWQISFNAHIID